MALATLYSRAQLGIEAPRVRVEVHLSGGLPSFAIVGMAETAVRESRERVRSALLNAGFEYPQRRITVNLSPADLPKEGGRYDLAIALGVDADATLDQCALGHPLVVNSRRCHGGSNVHIEYHRVEQGLQHRRNDQGAPRAASGQPGLAVFEDNRGGHRGEWAPIGRDGVGFSLNQSIGIGRSCKPHSCMVMKIIIFL